MQNKALLRTSHKVRRPENADVQLQITIMKISALSAIFLLLLLGCTNPIKPINRADAAPSSTQATAVDSAYNELVLTYSILPRVWRREPYRTSESEAEWTFMFGPADDKLGISATVTVNKKTGAVKVMPIR